MSQFFKYFLRSVSTIFHNLSNETPRNCELVYIKMIDSKYQYEIFNKTYSEAVMCITF